MDPLRRNWLKGAVASAGLLPLMGAGLLQPERVLAATWRRQAFSARTVQAALAAFGAEAADDSRDIAINAPDIAENGAKVDIEVVSNLPATRSIALFADRNPTPLCAVLEFGPGALPFSRLQIKLAETTRVRAVARTTDGKTYIASREIKVTLGGCGA